MNLNSIRYNFRILRALLTKEVLLMRRNPMIPKVLFMMPVAVMLLMPLVASFDVKRVGVAVVDNSNSPLARRIVADMSASEWIVVDTVTSSYSNAINALEHGNVDVILSLPRNLESQPGLIDISANGVNAIKGSLGAQYAAQSASMTIKRWQEEKAGGVADSSNQPSVINLYNPTQNYRFFMIPALIGILLIMICGYLPALNLVNEKETGTIEAMNVSPVGKFTFVLSKLIPFWIAGIIISAIGLTIGWIVYDLSLAGSIWSVLLATILFSLTMSGFGVTVANKSSTMMQSILVMFAIIMIFQLMGGLFTPVGSMPHWAQCITYGVPTRYYIDIMRAVYLKGSSISDLAFEFSILAAMGSSLCLLAAATYSKKN